MTPRFLSPPSGLRLPARFLALCANRPDNNVTLRDANWIFVLSRMRVVDEMGGKKAQLKLENLSIEDCFEALVRFACIKALPTVRAHAFEDCAVAPTVLSAHLALE